MSLHKLNAVASIALLCAAAAAHAASITIVNHSFEDDVVPGPTNIVSGVPNGWNSYSDGPLAGEFYGSLFAAPANYPAGAPDGNNVAVNFISANLASNVAFGIEQTLGAVLEAATLYSLTVEVGNIDSGFNDLQNTPNDPTDDPFFNIKGFNGYRVELRVDDGGDGITLEQDDNSSPIDDGVFETRSFVYDSSNAAPEILGLPLQIRLLNLNLVDPLFDSDDRETNFDNVRLDASPVPLPAALSLFTAALAIFGVLARRRCV